MRCHKARSSSVCVFSLRVGLGILAIGLRHYDNGLSCGKGRSLQPVRVTQPVHQALRCAWTGRTSVGVAARLV
jgi:hypothetical protein